MKKIFKKFHLKMNIFTAVKYCCILHGRVFVMVIGNTKYDIIPLLQDYIKNRLFYSLLTLLFFILSLHLFKSNK